MPISKNTYHCTVSEANQTLVSEYDITVSREFTNVSDDNVTKHNVDINISNAEPNNDKNKVSFGAKIFYGFVFGLNVLLIFFIVLLIRANCNILENNSSLMPYSKCISILLVLILAVLCFTFIKLIKNVSSYASPVFNTSYKSFFFYVIVLAIIFGCIIYVFSKTPKFNLLINTILIFFSVHSILWIVGNIYKAALSDEPKEYEEKINLVVQFNVSVLTLIGVFMDKIEKFDATGYVILGYAFALGIFLFAPFIISKSIQKLRLSFIQVKTNKKYCKRNRCYNHN